MLKVGSERRPFFTSRPRARRARRWGVTLCLLVVVVACGALAVVSPAAAVLALSFALAGQALFSLHLMLYAWSRPERLEVDGPAPSMLSPRLSFTVLLPARYEEAVIRETIKRVWAADYPKELLELVVICHAEDIGTIAEAEAAIAGLGPEQARVETFRDGPINKPRGLNVGLARSSNRVVAVFDAEDDVDPRIFRIFNTVMLGEETGIVQAGIQLMNFRDHWFGFHNCLEYYFWFKSRLRFHARVGMVPLGGNTVFIRRDLLERVGGWDETCLTEDAEIGLRLSALGEPIRVVYDARHVTREETPDSVGAFIRQRTRWMQGFLQVLLRGEWLRLPRRRQRLFAAYTLAHPFLQALLVPLWPAAVAAVVMFDLPLGVALASFLPLYALLFQFVASVVVGIMVVREYRMPYPPLAPITMGLTFLPVQALLGIAAVRAVWREVRHQHGWEKTAHHGAHRQQPGARRPSPLVVLRSATRWRQGEPIREPRTEQFPVGD